METSSRSASTPLSLRERNREVTRKAILSALQVVLERDGSNAPIAEVARLAGVSETTIYNYFTSREALLDALVEAELIVPDVLKAVLERPSEESPIDALRTVVMFVNASTATDADLAGRRRLYQAARSDKALWGGILRAHHEFATQLAETFLQREPKWTFMQASAAARCCMAVSEAAYEAIEDAPSLDAWVKHVDEGLKKLATVFK